MLTKPSYIIVGSHDEIMIAQAFKAFAFSSKLKLITVDNTDHLGIVIIVIDDHALKIINHLIGDQRLTGAELLVIEAKKYRRKMAEIFHTDYRNFL